MSKFNLFSLLAVPALQAKPITLVTCNGTSVTGLLLGISREDGSGRSFIVKLSTKNGERDVWIQTID